MNSGKVPESTITIIGSGPAGAVASLFLSKFQIPHTLLDQAVFPRDKVCGDGLSGKVVSVLNKLDTDLVEEFSKDTANFLGSWGVLFAAPNGKKLEIPFKKDMSRELHAPGFVCRRFVLDNLLYQKTASPFCNRPEGAKVTTLIKKEKGIEIAYTVNGNGKSHESLLVIGADGERSITRKTFFKKPFQPGHFFAGVRGYYKGVSGMHSQNFIELHFIKKLLPGYFWIFPLPDGDANVGVCVLSSRAGKEKLNLREIMLDIIAREPTICDRFKEATPDGTIKGWGLPLGSSRQILTRDNLLLTGDAASLIDPFTGEGIGNAMMSGMLSARAAKECMASDCFDHDFLKNKYEKVLYETIGDELKLSHTMQKLCRNPWLFNFVANKAEKNSTLRETISCMFEDLDMRTKLRSPAYYVKLLLNR